MASVLAIFFLMCGSCHSDRVLNVEIGVEYQMIFVVVFFNDSVKCILGHLQDLEKVGWFHCKTCPVIHSSFRIQQKTTK